MSTSSTRCHHPETSLLYVLLFLVQSTTADEAPNAGMWTALGIAFAIFFILSIFISCFKACLIRRRMQQMTEHNGRHIVVAVIPYGPDGRPRRAIRRTQMRLGALHSSGLTSSIQPPPTYEQTMRSVNTRIPPYINEPPPAYEPSTPPTQEHPLTQNTRTPGSQQPLPTT